MSKKLTIAQILNQAQLGDTLTDGTLYWKVTDTTQEGGDCTIAVPTAKWPKGVPKFELWADAMSDYVYLPGLRIEE